MNVLIVGGGICGLGTALMLARDGHEVTVLERDPDPPPAGSPQDTWERWERKGVAQFRQPHNLMPGFRLLVEAELPDVQDALRRSGASRYDLVHPLPPALTDRSAREVDDRLWTYSARRPVCEWIFAEAAAREDGVTIRRGVRAAGLLPGRPAADGIPHVAGIRTDRGEEIRADLVIDAMGRGSRTTDWLTGIGAAAPQEQAEDCGFVYYTRYFKGVEPERRGPVLTPLGTISLLTLTGDNGTWSVTAFAAAGDQPLKNLRHDEAWSKVVRACPLHGHWLDGEPITGVLAMSGVVDRYRRFVVDGRPVATGFVAVADAWACTNPSAGRGLTVGFLHARRLRDVLREAAGDARALVERFDEITEREIAPWYHAQIAVDRARFAEMDAMRAGLPPAPPADGLARDILGLLALMPADPDLFRAGLEYIGTVTPVQEVLRRPSVVERMQAVRARVPNAPPRAMPGPSREELLALVA